MRFIVDQTQTPNLKVSGSSCCFSHSLFPVWLVMCRILHNWEHLCQLSVDMLSFQLSVDMLSFLLVPNGQFLAQEDA